MYFVYCRDGLPRCVWMEKRVAYCPGGRQSRRHPNSLLEAGDLIPANSLLPLPATASTQTASATTSPLRAWAEAHPGPCGPVTVSVGPPVASFSTMFLQSLTPREIATSLFSVQKTFVIEVLMQTSDKKGLRPSELVNQQSLRI